MVNRACNCVVVFIRSGQLCLLVGMRLTGRQSRGSFDQFSSYYSVYVSCVIGNEAHGDFCVVNIIALVPMNLLCRVFGCVCVPWELL